MPCAQVARDIASQKSVEVPQLQLETAAQRIQHRLADQRQAAIRAAPLAPAIDGTQGGPSRDQGDRGGAPLQSVRRMHWQDRNTQGRIFGGVQLTPDMSYDV